MTLNSPKTTPAQRGHAVTPVPRIAGATGNLTATTSTMGKTGEVSPAVGTPETDLRLRVVWLLAFRALFTTALLVTLAAVRVTSPDSLFGRFANILYGVGSASLGLIALGALWLRLGRSRYVRELALVQLGFDALVAAIVVMLTGGVESVFVFVFSLTILNAGAVLQQSGARILAAVCAALYSVVLALQTNAVFVPIGYEGAPQLKDVLPTFLTNSASFMLVAVLVGYLAEQVKRTNERLNVARAELERLERLYAAVLESLPSGVLTVDGGSRVVYCNGAGADILGLSPAQLLGATLGSDITTLVDTGERFERTGPAGARGIRTIGGSAAALSGLEGVDGRVVVFQDLTELRRLQASAERAERLADLGRFAAGLAHEIRNPLAAMIGCLQLLNTDQSTRAALGEDGERMLSIVHREAERLSTLVTDFLVYARPAPPRSEVVVVRQLVDDAFAVLRAANANIAFDFVGNAEAICDAAQLRQVLWNIVGNAVNALVESGTSDPHIRIELRTSGKRHAVIVVDDNGPGVPVDVRGRIFEPFFTMRAKGTGLGLATSHQLIMQNGGTLLLSDNTWGGARFEIRLPAASTPASA